MRTPIDQSSHYSSVVHPAGVVRTKQGEDGIAGLSGERKSRAGEFVAVPWINGMWCGKKSSSRANRVSER